MAKWCHECYAGRSDAHDEERLSVETQMKPINKLKKIFMSILCFTRHDLHEKYPEVCEIKLSETVWKLGTKNTDIQ